MNAAPRINLILARAANGVIGANGALPWHLPEDMAHFKAQTAGAPVVMGRKTWDSLPTRFRPLPGRRNIVVTRQPNWQASGAERAGSVADAIALCSGAPQLWVIGGGEIYRDAMPVAQRALVTELAADFDGDAYAPHFDPALWHEIARSEHVSPASGLRFAFVTLQRG